MRKTMIAANWKMYKTVREAEDFISEFLPLIGGETEIEIDIVICPPFTCLPVVSNRLQGSSVQLGAQDVFWEETGAFTGEISPLMLKDLHCSYVIVGHSERRHLLGEDDLAVNRKLKAAIASGLVPIFCVGETGEERKQNMAEQVVSCQLEQGLKEIGPEKIVIAYEPVWAIGTGVNASPDDAQEMLGFIRRHLAVQYDKTWAEGVQILYGGSVNPDNIAQFVDLPDGDGALVGGASLNAHDFVRIARLNKDV